MLKLPAHHRESLQRPFGILYQDLTAVLPLLSGKQIYAVGDVVTHRLLRLGVVPDVAVIDGKTMRTPCSRTPDYHAKKVFAHNPPGTITDELIAAITTALTHSPSLVIVDGEEDLAVLPLVLAAPEGGILLYGQPNEGVVFREIDSQAKKDALNLLSLFTSN